MKKTFFFSSTLEKNDCDNYFNEYVKLNDNRKDLMQKSEEIYKNKEGKFEVNGHISKYLENEQIEAKYGLDSVIKGIDNIDSEMKTLSDEYKIKRERYYNSVDNASVVGNDISYLITFLKSLEGECDT